MKNKWIRKGDKVLILAGNDKGTVGEVMGRKGERIIVQGVNKRSRHMKSRDQNRRSEIVEMEMPVHISNVALCTVDGKKLKLKIKKDGDSLKELIYLDDDKEVSHRILRKFVTK